MSVKERLKEYLKYKGVNASEFGRSIGVSSAYISSMVKSIQPDKLQRIALEYPDLNTEWLLTGEDPMLKNNYNANILDIADNSQGVYANTGNIKGYVNNISVVLPEKGYVKIISPDGTIEIQHKSFIENAQHMIQEVKTENEDLRKQIHELNKTLLDTQKELITYLKSK